MTRIEARRKLTFGMQRQEDWLCSVSGSIWDDMDVSIRVTFAQACRCMYSFLYMMFQWNIFYKHQSPIKLHALCLLSCVCLPSHSWMVPLASTPSALFDRITHTHSSKLSSAAPSCRMLSSCVPALTDNPGKEGERGRAQRVTLDFWVIWEVAAESNLIFGEWKKWDWLNLECWSHERSGLQL